MRFFVLPLLTLALALPVFAGDGRLEINQSCAKNTGCFAGDAPGFPVTIDGSAGRSYVLTSDLAIPSVNLDAISISNDGVTIDLNGFQMSGAAACTGTGSMLTCDAGTGLGIDATSQDRITVRNGILTGFADNGIQLGNRGYVEGVATEMTGGVGISAIANSVIRDSRAVLSAEVGISVSVGSVVQGCTTAFNFSDGISAGAGSSIVGNAAYGNGDDGIDSSSGVVVRDNSAYLNEDDGIEASQGNLVSDNVAYNNTGDGISATADSSVQRNAVRSNTGLGLDLAGDAAYRENTINNNAGGTVSGGIDMEGNSCNGTMSCP